MVNYYTGWLILYKRKGRTEKLFCQIQKSNAFFDTTLRGCI